MPESRQPSASLLKAVIREGIAVQEVWPFVFATFLGGGSLTALGLMVFSSDILVLAGIAMTSLGIAGMWLAGRGALRNDKAMAIGLFLFGNFCTAASLTLSSSNKLLLVGMVFSAAGIGSMWIIGKHGLFPRIIWSAFVFGTTLQAVGLTVFPSKMFVSAGMVLVSGSVFGMWLATHPAPHVRDWERQEVVNIGIEGGKQAVELGHHGAEMEQHI